MQCEEKEEVVTIMYAYSEIMLTDRITGWVSSSINSTYIIGKKTAPLIACTERAIPLSTAALVTRSVRHVSVELVLDGGVDVAGGDCCDCAAQVVADGCKGERAWRRVPRNKQSPSFPLYNTLYRKC